MFLLKGKNDFDDYYSRAQWNLYTTLVRKHFYVRKFLQTCEKIYTCRQ